MGLMNPASLPAFEQYQESRDAGNLKVLTLLSALYGGFGVLVSSLGVMHMLKTMTQMQAQFGIGNPPEPMFASLIGNEKALLAIFLCSLVAALASLLGAFLLWKRKLSSAILVIAVIECLNIPVGTALGIFTIITLQRPSVRALFAKR